MSAASSPAVTRRRSPEHNINNPSPAQRVEDDVQLSARCGCCRPWIVGARCDLMRSLLQRGLCCAARPAARLHAVCPQHGVTCASAVSACCSCGERHGTILTAYVCASGSNVRRPQPERRGCSRGRRRRPMAQADGTGRRRRPTAQAGPGRACLSMRLFALYTRPNEPAPSSSSDVYLPSRMLCALLVVPVVL